ncbi:MAG: indolepyruvate ferredoxin oxidoreductase, partial [Acidobacteria bacterium]|nr:indolepyruvate ferredoxin oxidoreductase [Acidobacteriota bacterium]
VCLEPGNQQEAYDMAVEAFTLSERFGIPIMLRLVTRLAHSRADVRVADAPIARPSRAIDTRGWILLPALARRRWRSLLERQEAFREYTASHHNTLHLADRALGIVTAGVGANYFAECRSELATDPSHLHIGAYPIPTTLVRQLAAHVQKILVLEDGYPFVERAIRGLLPTGVEVLGRETAHLPPDGELTPDTVRVALGLSSRPGVAAPMQVPDRPPQLCAGCPHNDAFHALQAALAEFPKGIVTSDIGCYTLAALPPLQAIETCVCMGASIGMAKGASDAGVRPAVATIGDSTFLHSGIAPLVDAIDADTDMTVVILDNEVVAMTGAQPTKLPSSRLKPLLLGLGVNEAHCHVVSAHPRQHDANTEIVRRELQHPGLSVIVAVRECVEAVRARKAVAKRSVEVPS